MQKQGRNPCLNTWLCDSTAACEKLPKQHEALPGAAMAEMEAAHKRRLDEQKAETKAQYAKMLSEIQQLQNNVFRLKVGSLPSNEGYVLCQHVLVGHKSLDSCRKTNKSGCC